MKSLGYGCGDPASPSITMSPAGKARLTWAQLLAPSNQPSAYSCASTKRWHCVFECLPLSNHRRGKKKTYNTENTCGLACSWWVAEFRRAGSGAQNWDCQQGTDLLIMSSFRMPSAHCEKAALPRRNKAEGKAKELEDLSSFRISSLEKSWANAGCLNVLNLVIWVTECDRISQMGKRLLRELVRVCDIGPYGSMWWFPKMGAPPNNPF